MRTGRGPKSCAERNRRVRREARQAFADYRDNYRESIGARYCDGLRATGERQRAHTSCCAGSRKSFHSSDLRGQRLPNRQAPAAVHGPMSDWRTGMRAGGRRHGRADLRRQARSRGRSQIGRHRRPLPARRGAPGRSDWQRHAPSRSFGLLLASRGGGWGHSIPHERDSKK